MPRFIRKYTRRLLLGLNPFRYQPYITRQSKTLFPPSTTVTGSSPLFYPYDVLPHTLPHQNCQLQLTKYCPIIVRAHSWEEDENTEDMYKRMLNYWTSDYHDTDTTISKICKDIDNEDKRILDLNLLRLIKDCLYDERFTVKSYTVQPRDIRIDFLKSIDGIVKIPNTLFNALRMRSEYSYKLTFTVDRNYFYMITLILPVADKCIITSIQ